MHRVVSCIRANLFSPVAGSDLNARWGSFSFSFFVVFFCFHVLQLAQINIFKLIFLNSFFLSLNIPYVAFTRAHLGKPLLAKVIFFF